MTVGAVPQAPAPGDLTATLVDHLRRQVRTRGDQVALRFFGGGRWVPISWSQFGVAVDRMAGFLLEEGVAPGDHVAIWSAGRPEWCIADAAVLSIRARSVPVHPTSTAERATDLLGRCEARVAIVETAALLDVVGGARHRLPALRRIVVMHGLDLPGADGVAVPWSAALEGGKAALPARSSELARLANEIEPDDVATLVDGGGAAGPSLPLTHQDLLAGVARLLAAGPDDRVLSLLPPAEIAERLHSEVRGYVAGSITWFSRGADRLGEDLVEVRPTLVLAGPPLWETLAVRVRGRLASARGPRGALARWALAEGRRAAQASERGEPSTGVALRRHTLADRLVLSGVRRGLGLDQARLMAARGAPPDPETAGFLAALGLPVEEVDGPPWAQM